MAWSCTMLFERYCRSAGVVDRSRDRAYSAVLAKYGGAWLDAVVAEACF
ncbi:hypothetical protein SMICM17S_13088 [Streptomyces microflavus]